MQTVISIAFLVHTLQQQQRNQTTTKHMKQHIYNLLIKSKTHLFYFISREEKKINTSSHILSLWSRLVSTATEFQQEDEWK